MDLGLAGRVYILTGASRGLGYATAEYLVADGARVVVSSRDHQRVTGAVRRLNDAVASTEDASGTPGAAVNATGRGAEPDTPATGDVRPDVLAAPHGATRATGVAGSLADPELPHRLIEAALDTFGRLDGALISVGGPPLGTAAAVTDQQWIESFQTVFLGAVRLARTVVRRLDRGGAIGFVLSSSVRAPIPGLGISNGLRPGLAGVAKDMADEFGPAGIRVFSLLPHRILTERNRELFEATGDPAAARAAAEAAIPLRRLGRPDEFGRAATFLLSPAASYLTGLSLPVDGGAIRLA